MHLRVRACIDSSGVKSMQQRRYASALAAGIGMLILILDSRTALAGAGQGLSLCLKTVIPSLFPFLFLSGTFSHACARTGLTLRLLGKPFGVPAGMTSILVPALLGGYPVGAQCVYEAFRVGSVDRRQAERMLAFCSNVGPAFLFGILPAAFPGRGCVWLLWGVQLIGIWSASFVFSAPEEAPAAGHTASGSFGMEQAIRAMLKICGWVILFRVGIVFLERWLLWAVSAELRVAVIGLLELSNGCCMLQRIPAEGVRFFVCSILLSFGGVCVLYQTASVCPGLSLKYYLLGKVVQAATAAVVSAGICFRLWPLPPIWFAILLAAKRAEKRSSNSGRIGV